MAKSGFVAIIGRPSAGKSTLLNAICGEKVAITSPVPQTTRNAIRGIVNRPDGQIVFLDTPGYHDSDKKLNIYLKDTVHRSLDDADVVLYVIDASRPPGKEEASVMDLLGKSKKPVVTAVNKTDLPTPLLAEIRGLVRTHLDPVAMTEVSAATGSAVEGLVAALLEHCPEGIPHYPEDFYTDQEPEFRIAEIIREEAIARSEKEVPHALYVDIADMEFGDPEDRVDSAREERGRKGGGDAVAPAEERTAGGPEAVDEAPDGDEDIPAGAPPGFFDGDGGADAPAPPRRRTLWVRAFLVVERPSQVGILVGRGGERIKAIRIASLRQMKKIFPWKVRLDLRVKVNPKWRKKDPLLKRMLGPGES